MSTIIYLFRHGATISDETNCFCGWEDEDLTPTGLADVQEAISTIISKLKFGTVFTDDLMRTVHTAELALPYSQTAKQLTMNEGALTWGIGDVLSGQPKNADNLAKKELYVDNPDMMPEGGNAETINHSKARQNSFLTYVASVTPPDMPSLVVWHSSGFKNTAKVYNENKKIKVNTTGIVKMEISSDGVQFTVLREGRPSVKEPDADRSAASLSSFIEELEVRADQLMLRYSPDQPREPNGEFGSTETYYHGTTTDNALKIWKQGMPNGGYVTKDEGWAHQYGASKASDIGQSGYAVVKVEHDSAVFEHDPEHDDTDAQMTSSAIPKSSVKEIKFYDENAKLRKTITRSYDLRYSPDQPRDDHGRFGEGNGTLPGSSFIKDMEMLKPEMSDHEAKSAIVRNEARRQGYPVEKLDIKEGAGRVLDVAGHKFNEGANANLQTGVITFFPDVMPDGHIGGLLAHEIEHQRFQTVLDAYKAEGQHLNDMAQHDHEGFDKVTDPAGFLDKDKGAYAQFPNQTALQPYLQVKDSQLTKEDGVTEYSKAYWEGHAQGKVSFDLAVHETLAEMARMKYSGSEYPKGDKPTKLWQSLFKEVNTLAKEQGFGK